jgi:hypothetical protein
MQDCGRLCANETVAAVVSASASVTASFVTKDDVMAYLRGVAVVEQDAPRDESARQAASAGRSKIGRLQLQHATRATARS